jgi:hypothetical protein
MTEIKERVLETDGKARGFHEKMNHFSEMIRAARRKKNKVTKFIP